MKFETLKKHIFSLVAARNIEVADALTLLQELSEKEPDDSLAVVGMSIRFPNANTTEQFWDDLVKRRSMVGCFPRERFELVVQTRQAFAQQYESKWKTLDSDPRAYASWLHRIEQFEPEAFGFSPHEAQFLGPAERLFMQAATEGLARAGYSRSTLHGSQTGVFIAHTPYPPFEYLRLFDEQDERAFIANIPANLGYHLSYALNLRGPVLTVNSSCSSSLAALHVAKNALRQGDCDLAVVGGVNLILFPFWDEAPDYVVRSRQYRCASYDAEADGIIGSEGIAVVVLKRLGDALRDRDYIHAIVKGSGMSSDGTSNGMQVPNPAAQAQAIRAALTDAGLSARSIGYLEGHGAGTPVGDLIEVDGLTSAFRQETEATSFCRLGSIKSNLGHMGDAAGVAGLIKAILCLEHKFIPGIAHFKQANPKIPFAQTPFIVSAENTAWEAPENGEPRHAGVNSIGLSGTNVHVIVEEYQPENAQENAPLDQPVPLFFSASTRWALWELIQAMAEKLERNQHWQIQDIIYTLNVRRSHEQARIGIFVSSTEELVDKLNRLLQVRSFERAPEIFFTQGIFLADDGETRGEGLAHFDHYITPTSTQNLALMKDFLQGEDITQRCAEDFAKKHLLPLPVAPFKTRSIWPSSEAAPQRNVSDLFFEARWEAYPSLEAPTEHSVASEQGSLWLILARHEDTILAELSKQLTAAGMQVVLALPGARFARVGDDRYEVAPDQLDSFEHLFNALGQERLARLTGIIHGFSFKPANGAMDTLEELENCQKEGVFSLFCLAKAVIHHELIHPIRLVALSSLAEQIIQEDTCLPVRVTTFGLAKVISQERPTISTLAIDHDLQGDQQAIATQILAEILDTTPARRELVAYRRGKRFTKIVERQPQSARRAIPIREGGTYVIAGGTGYLGVQVGLFLSQRAKVNIVLLARKPLPDRSAWESILAGERPQHDALIYTISNLKEIEARGSRVDILQCDVTDPEAVTRVFSSIRSAYGNINGAFMLAKQLYHLWLHELTFEQFQAGIDNRVKGTWLIEREIRSPELDFFIPFSSISSLLGTKSASECCAVNQFLDAMSGYLNKKGTPTHVLNFTLILDDKSDFGSKTPIPPIDFTDFHNVLSRFFSNGYTWSLVARFDLEEVHFLKPVLKIPFGPVFWREVEEFMKNRKEQHTSAEQEQPGDQAVPGQTIELDAQAISQRVEEIWRKVLGIESPQKQANFFSCGGTSLSALRFVQLFRKSFANVSFQVTDLYSLPTFEAQVAYCEQALCPKDMLAELFDALENDDISMENALALFEKSARNH